MASLSENELRSIEAIAVMAAQLKEGQVVRHVGFTGGSMLPMLRQGKDSVELTKAPDKLRKYDLPMYMGPRGKYVMHRIVDVKDEHYVCLGDNTYHREKVKREQIVALVCAFRRGEKRISVEAPGYKLYCRLWCALFPVRRLAKKAKSWLRRRMR